MTPKQLKVTTEVTSENKCSFCTGSLCCNYTTQEIDTPRSMEDFDHLLWHTAHQNIQIYKDEGTWYILVNNKCNFLQTNGRCGIYETRPMVCREHSNDYCEFDAPAEEGFELFFDSYDTLLKYCKKRFKNWDRRFDKLEKN